MTTPKNVAVVVPSLNAGGMERVATLTANLLADCHVQRAILITLTRQHHFFRPDSRVKVISPSFDALQMNKVVAAIRTVRFLRNFFKKERVDCCISFGDRYNSLSVLATAFTQTRIYVSNRQNPDLGNGRIIDLINRVCYPFASGLIAQTRYAQSIFKAKRLNKRIACIANPVPTQQPVNTERLNWVVNVGRFADQKNQSQLIRMFDQIDLPNWELWLVGDGPKKEIAWQAKLRSRRNEQIHFAGCVSDVSHFYITGAIFAFSSRSEGFPNALAEAMSFGMAVIAYDCKAGPSDLIEHRKNGLLIPDGNESLFAEGLKELMLNPHLRNSLGIEARKKAAAFSEEAYLRKLLRFVSMVDDEAECNQ
jgi:glycosyltransferase involved in cell wall biosynthesis